MNYLLKRIDFLNDNFFNRYVGALEMSSSRFRSLAKIKKVWVEEMEQYVPESFINKIDRLETNYFEEFDNYFLPKWFGIVDYLNLEIKFKKFKLFKMRGLNTSSISATDISNYTYCPVSFSIARTFEIDKIESAEIGIGQHNLNILQNYIKPFRRRSYDVGSGEYIEVEVQNEFDRLIDQFNKNFIVDVRSSEIVFTGHKDGKGENVLFSNLKENFYGQPDYIFQNRLTSEYFVVEEKFVQVPNLNYVRDEEQYEILSRKVNSRHFHKSHVNQLNSYIHGIENINLSYGYLVYWRYVLDSGSVTILSCRLLKISKTMDGRTDFVNNFREVFKVIKGQGGGFNVDSRVPEKCALCVSGLLCGHKTGKFKEFTFPYDLKYHKLTDVEFPEELK